MSLDRFWATFRHGGFVWRFPGGEGEVFARDFCEGRGLPPPLKRNAGRTLHRVLAWGGAGAAYVKVYFPRGRLDAAVSLLLRSRAQLEAEAYARLAEAGMPTADFIAWGERRTLGVLRSAVVATREVAGARDLYSLCRDRRAGGAGPATAEQAASLLASLGALAARLHDAGVLHGDFQAGNVLVASGGDDLRLVDLHACVETPAPARGERLANVALLCHSLGETFAPGHFGPLLAGYEAASRSPERLTPADLADLSREIDRVHRTHVFSRARRALRVSSRYDVARAPGVGRLFRDRRYPLEEVLREAVATEGRFQRETGPWAAFFFGRGRRSRSRWAARRRWVELNALAVDHLLYGTPVALVERRAALWRRESVILIDPDTRPAPEPDDEPRDA
ncbi:MAG: hypothetical protein HY719_16115 [Planctomycetes bacterium]|nr:hypothetical protein [Planctomycetota bacterium]